MMQIDELIVPRWIIPIEPHGTVLENHALAIRAGKIEALLPLEEAHRRFEPACETVLASHVLTPGLVNLHTHAAMTLLRGVGDDLSLRDWLETRIWPTEQALVSHEFVLEGTRLACLEMLMGGITCFNDMYFFPDAAAQAAQELGMRACLGITIIDFPSAWASDAEDYLRKGLAVRDAYRDDPLLSFCLAPHALYTVGDAHLMHVATLAEQLNVPIHIHLHETQDEIASELARSGQRPIARLESLGLVGPQLIAVHAVHLDAAEIELFAQHGVTLAHCPSSNLKLGSGIAPIARCLDAGVRIGLGTDGAASNNRLDMLSELRLAALLAKGASGRPDVFSAHEALRAATLHGAMALGLETQIGSIEEGKQADLTAFDLGGLDCQPCFDPASHLVFVTERTHVTNVWVAGHSVVQKRQFVQPAAREAGIKGASAVALWQNRAELRLASLR
ncbi:MAG: TRZ/ATZ family hydrolase [Burkholderiaceae bacterium]|jgi:5-methylthioadenosine/S-adenosylhomocysteine deaminase